MIDVGATVRLVHQEVARLLVGERQTREQLGRPPLAPAEERARAGELADQVLARLAAASLRDAQQPPSTEVDAAVRRAVLNELFGLGGLQPLLDDARIENIHIIGDRVTVRYADGRRERREPVAHSDDDLIALIRRLAASGVEERRFDRASPRLNLALADGSRMYAAMVVSGRPMVVIRRHRYQRISLEDLVRLGTISEDLRTFLARAVAAGRNLLISGGPGAGKTTLLRALAAEIPWDAPIVTIEDPLELGLDRDGLHEQVFALQPREPNLEGHGEITLADLVRDSLRMAPDYLIVGEVRGPEVTPMLIAMSAGSLGSMSTIHAESSQQVTGKLTTYASQTPLAPPSSATRELIGYAVHLIVHIDWITGRRVVSSIREVTGPTEGGVATNEIWGFDPAQGMAVTRTPMSSRLVAALNGPTAMAPALARPAFAPLEQPGPGAYGAPADWSTGWPP